MNRHIPRYGVFIVESMDKENEIGEKLDGKVLRKMLDLCDIPNQYIYIRTKQELNYAMELFRDTDFGFLHISCHGNETGLCLSLDDIPFDELENIIGPYIKYRRIFLSACKVTCFDMAERFIPQYHCYSIMGPSDIIEYDLAAIFWSSYYYLMYRDDQQRMWQRKIVPTLEHVTRTFKQQITYFSIIKESHPKSKFALREIHFIDGQITFDQVRATNFQNIYWEEAIANPDPRGESLQEPSTHDSYPDS